MDIRNNVIMMCEGSSELFRISTYFNWKSDISPLPFARSGYLYSGRNDEVVCFACNTHFDGLSAIDILQETHRQSSPNCPLVRGDAAGNIALKINHSDKKYATSQTTTDNAELDIDRAVLQDKRLDDLTKIYYVSLDRARKKGLFSNGSSIQLDRLVLDFDKLRLEEERLRTFQNWPLTAKAKPDALAGAGFFYTGSEDRVQCAFCRGCIHTWLSTDVPKDEHKKYYPECRFICGADVGNVPLIRNSDAAAPTTTNQCDGHAPATHNLVKEAVAKRSPGQIQPLATSMLIEPPKYPEFSDIGRRIQSFRVGKVSNGQTAEGLAEAGWYFIGPGDKVYCFQCGGNLKDWEPEDDPWEEHKKWYPLCAFIKNNKRKIQNQPVMQVATRVYQPEPREIKARMDTPTVRAIMDIGYSRDLVKMAIENRLSTAGDDFPNAESLLEALFELEEAGTQSKRSMVALTPINAAETLNISSAADRSDEDWHTCKICRLLPWNLIFKPCGHGSCQRCYANCRQERGLVQGKLPCPFCTALIHEAVPSITTDISGLRTATTALSSPVPSSQSSIARHQPDSESLPPSRSASSIYTNTTGSCQSMIPALTEKPAAAAAISVAADNELVAEGQIKAKGKRKRNKKKKTSGPANADDDQAAEISVAPKNDQERVEGDSNIEDIPDEEAQKYLEENRQLREARTCKVCMDAEVNTVFLPCGHLVCCNNCSPHLKNCPICRTFIRGTVKTFLS